jgi:hypothetical protein
LRQIEQSLRLVAGQLGWFLYPLAGLMMDQDKTADPFLHPHIGAPMGLVREVTFRNPMASSFFLDQARRRGS